ncbi:MAG: hypothetical protein AAGJ40_02900 [Planctomycetota bacterium]
MADLSITPASVGLTASTAVSSVQVGEAVTQGQPGYLNATDGKYYLSQADDTSVAAAATVIFLTGAPADGYAVVARQSATIDIGATLTIGTMYVVSATKGGVAPATDLTSGDYVTQIGLAKTTSSIKLTMLATGAQVA